MTDAPDERLAAAYLDELAFVTLTAIASGTEIDLYPVVDESLRSQLRSRIKQLSRYDWPSSLGEDPLLRRGYTLRQLLRIVTTLLLLDASIPLRTAISLARDNERAFLIATADRLNAPSRLEPSDKDRVTVIIPGEVRTALLLSSSDDQHIGDVQLVPRHQLGKVWSYPVACAGSRLLVDVGAVALVVWYWLSGRRLMADTARQQLLAAAEQERDKPTYAPVPFRNKRR